MVKSKNLAFEYIRRDVQGNVESVQRALNDININIKEGEFVAILGHNGSGKSTFAKQINALLLPTEGTIWISGMDSKESRYFWEIRQNAGMVFQNPDNQLIASIVEDDVAFGPENLGIPSEEIRERVKKSLISVGMYDYRNKSPNHLSGGQKQRIAIAGIMAMKPKCIVLDEPTAMLDPNGRKEVIETMKQLNQSENITVILITHYMEEVISADRVFVMEKGNVVMEGTPREIFSRVEELKKYRLDVPQVTELAYELRKEGLPLPEVILTKEELVQQLLKIKG